MGEHTQDQEAELQGTTVAVVSDASLKFLLLSLELGLIAIKVLYPYLCPLIHTCTHTDGSLMTASIFNFPHLLSESKKSEWFTHSNFCYELTLSQQASYYQASYCRTWSPQKDADTGTVWRILKGSSPPHPKCSATAFSRWVYVRRSHKHFTSSNTPEAETCFFILYLSYLVLKYQELGCFIEYYYHRAVKWAFSYCSASRIKWKAFKIKFYYQYWPALKLLASSWNNGSNAWKKYALE